MRRKRRRVRSGLLMIVAIAIAIGIGVRWAGQPEAPFAVPKEVTEASKGAYAYETLSDNGKKVYDQMVYAIEQREEYVSLATTDVKAMQKAYLALRFDHCEYFWTDSYQYEMYHNAKNDISAIYFYPIYDIDQEMQQEYQEQIDAAVQTMLKDLPADATDFEKVCYVYTTLIKETDYREGSDNNQNIISTFLNHETVCQGYAYGAQYLLDRLGIPCGTVCGTTENTNHSWNLIQMDGDYYYMDVTWGEAEYWKDVQKAAGEDFSESQDYVNYNYLGVSDADAEFMSEHQAFDDVALPACTATKDNYFVHEGLYFEEVNGNEIGAKIRDAYEAGDKEITLKFANEDIYDEAFVYLIENQHWADYCDTRKIAYVDGIDTNLLLLKFL